MVLQPLKLVLLHALLLASLTGARTTKVNCDSGVQDTLKNFIFRIFPTMNYISHEGHVLGWSKGGGKPELIGSDAPIFAGRQYGGGSRSQIYGTRAYGSGYPYGADDTTTVKGRPFPFGPWPVSFAGYLGGEEYLGPQVEVQRPGGQLAVIKVGSTNTTFWPGITGDEVYEMVGDRDSIVFMMADLVNWCHATPAWPTAFDPTNPSPKPEQVIQYYRASSFALSYFAYNNTFAHPSSNPHTSFGYDQSTALPSNISNSAFLHCVNDTIATALPIMEKKPLSDAAQIGMVLGPILGGIALVFAWVFCMAWRDKKRSTNAAAAAAAATEMQQPLNTPYTEVSSGQQTGQQTPYKDTSGESEGWLLDGEGRRVELLEVGSNDVATRPGVTEVDIRDLHG